MDKQTDEGLSLDLIWGVEAIAAFINRTPRQTYHMLSKGAMPGKHVGERWVVDRRDLVAFFRGAQTEV